MGNDVKKVKLPASQVQQKPRTVEQDLREKRMFYIIRILFEYYNNNYSLLF